MQACMSLAVISIAATFNPEGGVQKRIQAVAMSDWRVSLQDPHEGYITLEEFFKNQERLAKNRTNGEETLLSGPAREGLALLQGLLLWSACGRALTVRYTGNGGIYPCYLCNRLVGSPHPITAPNATIFKTQERKTLSLRQIDHPAFVLIDLDS